MRAAGAGPDLRGKPVGVVPLMAETTVCLAASREAKKYGVKTGTLVAEARIRCPEITFIVARHDLYTLYHKTIIEAVETCIPIDSILSIDEMICELRGSQRELPNARALAAKIKTTLRQRVGETLTCSIGLASNRFLAKVASDMNKPNGLTIMDRPDLPYALYPLKLRDFPGDWSTDGTAPSGSWNLLGERTLRAPHEQNDRSLGWCRGGTFLPLAARRRCGARRGGASSSLGHQHVLEPEFRTAQGAWMVTKKLLVKAAVRSPVKKATMCPASFGPDALYRGSLLGQRNLKLKKLRIP